MRFKQLLRSQWFHFTAIGLLIALGQDSFRPNRIHISETSKQTLFDARAKQLGIHTLTALEKDAVLNRYIDDEVLYREALRLGLDQGDHVIRQRLIQKMHFLYRDQAPVRLENPKESAAASRYEVETVSGEHLFYKNQQDYHNNIATSFMPITNEFQMPLAKLVDVFGQKKLESLKIGVWSEPIRSRYGWHKIKMSERKITVRHNDEISVAIAEKLAAQKEYFDNKLEEFKEKYDITF